MVEGQTALHAACQNGHCDIIRELIDRGADKDKRVSSCTLLIHSYITHVCSLSMTWVRSHFLQEEKKGISVIIDKN